MCGIAGVFEARRDAGHDLLRARALRMAGVLHHRGPDDEDAWADPAAGIAFGHRRLAILDLTDAGRQPMRSACGRYVAVLNGEIYNFRGLRRVLENAGEAFRGHSDTEVMLAAFSRWGVEATLPRLNGMFAIAVWDRNERLLYLVRDRLGEKPLYYGWVDGAFLFGSELKALRAGSDGPFDIDRDALTLLLRYKYIPAPRSIYRGISKLPPGCVLTLDTTSSRLRGPAPYWSAADAAEAGVANPFTGSIEDAVDLLDELLRDSVRMRLEADVPLGAFLSGGVDSSVVVSLMQRESTGPVRTFTVGLDEAGFNEADQARAVARHLGTEHTEVVLTPAEAMDVIPRLPALYDEPFSDSSQIPTFLISEFARRHVTVALSGDGGDELFGGYNRHAWLNTIWRRVGWLPPGLRRAAGGALQSLSPRTWDALFRTARHVVPDSLNVRTPGEKIHKLAGVLAARDREHMYLSVVSHWKDPASVVIGADEPSTPLTDRQGWAKLTDFTQLMMYLDAVTYLPDDILTKVDRASMGVGLEMRVPFLDHRVFEFAWRLPPGLNMANGEGKRLLRHLLHRYVPAALVDRPKMGFGIPIGTWLRGPLRDWADALLEPSRLRNEGFFDPGPIAALWADHLAGRRNGHYALWDVLMFQAWLESTISPAGAPLASVTT